MIFFSPKTLFVALIEIGIAKNYDDEIDHESLGIVSTYNFDMREVILKLALY